MKAITGLFPFSGLSLVKGLFGSPKPPSPAQPVTTDQARDQALRNDELLRRRGGAADLVTGAYGAEASPGTTGKTTLGG